MKKEVKKFFTRYSNCKHLLPFFCESSTFIKHMINTRQRWGESPGKIAINVQCYIFVPKQRRPNVRIYATFIMQIRGAKTRHTCEIILDICKKIKRCKYLFYQFWFFSSHVDMIFLKIYKFYHIPFKKHFFYEINCPSRVSLNEILIIMVSNF